MYRLELKAPKNKNPQQAPHPVPNVPCGVERTLGEASQTPSATFLMYRLELKGPRAKPPKLPGLVPNVPCGVGSQAGGTLWQGGMGS